MYTERRKTLERRCESRYPRAGKIFWQRPGRKLHIWAWLSDTSLSGVSFITPTGRRLAVNEHIELNDRIVSAQRCRVARITPYDRRLSLVACEALAENILL